MAEHTPGPWAESKFMGDIRVVATDAYGNVRKLIAVMPEQKEDNEIKPNTCLIIAAPDLLTACEGALNEIWRIGTDPDTIDREYQVAAIRYLQAAVAKARR